MREWNEFWLILFVDFLNPLLVRQQPEGPLAALDGARLDFFLRNLILRRFMLPLHSKEQTMIKYIILLLLVAVLSLNLIGCDEAASAPIGQVAPTATAATEPEEPAAGSPPAAESDLPFEIQLPPGFTIQLYATDIPNARSMALSPNGTLFVGSRTEGKFYAVVDADQDYRADEVVVLGEGMNMPNGVAFREGALYVAEIGRILRYDNIEADLHNPPEPVVVSQEFPTDQHHGWKFIRFGPDGLLYVPVGAPCNVCEPPGPLYNSITRMQPDGSGLEVYAEGARNSVGFDFHPETGVLWFTDNGRDQMGDDVPPDELNRAPEPGLHFGFPYCHGGTIADPEFGQARSCDEFTPPAIPLGPHVAALGMRFYTGEMFPAEYQGQIFIAEHGSWNRSTPIGYRVMLVRLEGSEAVSYEPFAEGWLRDGQTLGRPVDLLILPDGSMLVSDDYAGAIYRISYNG
jgi:glucose/arabinose dehydrogenase